MKVSILCPTYQHEKFIGQAIESVLAQTHSDWELIIIDDDSPDRTAEIARSYSDPRIRVESQPHQGIEGLGNTYNRALSLAIGELIAILEGDDLFPPTKLESQTKRFENPSVILASSPIQIIDSEGADLGIHNPNPPESAQTNWPLGASAAHMLRPDSLLFTFPVATMVRRSALEKAGGFYQPTGMPVVDFPTFLNLSWQGEWRWDESPMGIWRRHTQSTTSARLANILDGAARLCEQVWSERKSQFPNAAQLASELQQDWTTFQSARAEASAREAASAKDFVRAQGLFAFAAEHSVSSKRRKIRQFAAKLASLKLSPELLYKSLKQPAFQDLLTIQGDRSVPQKPEPADFRVPNFTAAERPPNP